MRGIHRSTWVVLVGVLGLVASPGEAQVFGPFTMQLAPFCNVITFTVTAQGPIFNVAGFDDNCGGASRLAASGSLFFNPSGSVGGGLSIVDVGQAASQVALTIDPAGPSGTWTDNTGNSGTLVFGVGSGSGTPRTAGESVLALNPYAAEGRDTANASLLGNFGNARFCTGTCALHVPFNLPSGAIIIGLAVAALDQSASGEVSAQLLRCPLSSSCSLLGPVVSTGVADQPGLTQVRDNLATPHTVDNGTNTYAVFVAISGGTDQTRLIGLRVFYRLP